MIIEKSHSLIICDPFKPVKPIKIAFDFFACLIAFKIFFEFPEVEYRITISPSLHNAFFVLKLHIQKNNR